VGVRTIVIHTLGELMDRVTPSEPDAVTGRRRDTGVYRGSSNQANPLRTSLDRLGGVNPAHSKSELEEHILRNFIRYSRPYLGTDPVNDWEQLVSAQHHGVPTRLLDWTYSPLVGAFFATRTYDQSVERDRAVWRLDWKSLHERFDLPGLSLLIQDVQELFGKEEQFTPWALMRRGAIRDFACLLEPPSLDQRIVVQAVICAFEFNDLVASSCGAGEPDGVHRDFSSTIAEANHLDRKAIADLFRKFPLHVMRHAEHGAGAQALLNCFHHRRMAMSGHDRAKAKVVIDVLVAIKIAKLAAARIFHKYRIRIVSAVIAGDAQRNALQVFLVRLCRLRRAPHISVEFFL